MDYFSEQTPYVVFSVKNSINENYKAAYVSNKNYSQNENNDWFEMKNV